MGRTGGAECIDTTQFQSTRECPNCMSNQTSVINSRSDANGVIRRRKKCISCGCKWYTYEISEEDLKDMLDRQEDIIKADKMIELKKEIMRKTDMITNETRKLNALIERVR